MYTAPHKVGSHLKAAGEEHWLTNPSSLLQREGVMYTAPHKVGSHLKAAGEGGIAYMVYSTLQELPKIKRAAPNARYIILPSVGIRDILDLRIRSSK